MSQVRWLSPSPLWDDLVAQPAGFRAPALLRFGGDDFIDQWQAALAADPGQIRGFVARPESWREPAVGLATPPSPKYPLRLYQPVHGRYYLVSASLACRVPGLPEHTVDVAGGDVVAFVLRRITVNASGAETGEWAWVKRVDGSEGWSRAAGPALVADEEQLPLFATTYTGKGGGTKGTMRRRVFAGLVPASRREAYVNGREVAAQAPVPAPAPGPLDDPRIIDFQFAVLDPWVEMKAWYDGERYDETRRASALASVEATSALVLLDFHDFLRDRVTPVWNVMQGTASRTSLGTGAHGALYDALAAAHATDRSNARSATLVAAMNHAAAFRGRIESMTFAQDSNFVPRVLIGDPRRYKNPPPQTPVPFDNTAATAEEGEQATLLARLSSPLELNEPPVAVGVRRLKKLVMDALAAVGPAPAALPEQLPTRAPAAAGDDWFVVRCVYLRPRCGRKSPPVVSERSERFRLVSFFEPDAPARHLRVALPVDTSPATLRRYNRNVAFALSDQLRKQMSRAASLKDLMDGKAGEEGGGLDFAVICSFSIPIITICALILLMIIVSLLNIIFWWLPLFRICFPIPKLKG
ncbi:MAG TPA: hypothetical protein VFR37_19530 [Longimicrobium sp.]|nr:hypothetical protein [Longimicrobium sp.]